MSQENNVALLFASSVSERSDHQVNINGLCHIKKHVHMVQWVGSPRRPGMAVCGHLTPMILFYFF